MTEPKEYFEQEYGKDHIDLVVNLGDTESLYGLMQEYTDKQLKLCGVGVQSEQFFATVKWAKQADLDYPDDMLLEDFEGFKANN